ncbi:MAG: CARDB domain-containing protein [Dehalococcoidia bacterium]
MSLRRAAGDVASRCVNLPPARRSPRHVVPREDLKYILIITLASVLPLSGCLPPLSDIVFTTQVDPAGKPLNSSSTFTIDTPSIICSVVVEGLPAPSQVKAEWLYHDVSAWKSLKEDSSTVAGSSYLAFSINSPAAGWQQGDYSVRLYLDGQQKSEKGFSIKLEQGTVLPEIRNFQATPANVTLGQQFTLTWNVSGASRVIITPDIGAVPAGGNKLVSPKADTTYSLNAINNGGATSKSVAVTVVAPSISGIDLVVVDIFREASMIYYTVKNNGDNASKGCNAGLYLGPTQLGTSYIPPMLPGEQRTLYFGTYNWNYVYDTPATVCADIDNQNNVKNTGDNCLIRIISSYR